MINSNTTIDIDYLSPKQNTLQSTCKQTLGSYHSYLMASALFGNESDMARHTLVRSQYNNFRMKYLTFRSLPRAATHKELLSLAKGNLLSINTAQTSNQSRRPPRR